MSTQRTTNIHFIENVSTHPTSCCQMSQSWFCPWPICPGLESAFSAKKKAGMAHSRLVAPALPHQLSGPMCPSECPADGPLRLACSADTEDLQPLPSLSLPGDRELGFPRLRDPRVLLSRGPRRPAPPSFTMSPLHHRADSVPPSGCGRDTRPPRIWHKSDTWRTPGGSGAPCGGRAPGSR